MRCINNHTNRYTHDIGWYTATSILVRSSCNSRAGDSERKNLSDSELLISIETIICVYGDCPYMSEQQQQQQPQLFQYSVKIEMTAKGLAMPTIHVYSNEMEEARKQAVEQYTKVIEELKAKGLPVATPDFKT